jgi:hypothetical protein
MVKAYVERESSIAMRTSINPAEYPLQSSTHSGYENPYQLGMAANQICSRLSHMSRNEQKTTEVTFPRGTQTTLGQFQ